MKCSEYCVIELRAVPPTLGRIVDMLLPLPEGINVYQGVLSIFGITLFGNLPNAEKGIVVTWKVKRHNACSIGTRLKDFS